MSQTTHRGQLTLPLYPEEYWYGGCVSDGHQMPYGAKTDFSRDLTVNLTENQAAPLLISNQGRYIWSETGFAFTFRDGILTVDTDAELYLGEGFGTLRGAFQAVSQRFFPPSGDVPPEAFFSAPQFNTWIELLFNQNQQDVLTYAQTLIEKGYPAGVLMIDATWAEHFGNFSFHSGRFPDPKGMVEQLHAWGFRVMLWESPFVTADTLTFRTLAQKGYLIRNPKGEVAIKHWWDGYSAMLDMTNPETVAWLTEQNEKLMTEYGIDGFKLDAGDPLYYDADDVTYAPTTPNGHSEIWAKFGLRYPYNEYRACFKCGGQALVQRLCDKQHSWAANGLGALVPHTLAQGLLGYTFGCPDMIGGGQYGSFLRNSGRLDQELFVRYAQCAAMMPMMQFSAAPWRVLDPENEALCRQAALLHTRYGDLFWQLAREAAATGEPIVRSLEYVCPHQGFAAVTDTFMLGDDLLVAPVLNKGETVRNVPFPTGCWVNETTGESIQGPTTRDIPVTPDTLLIYKRATNN